MSCKKNVDISSKNVRWVRSLWAVYPTTHCDVITALSNQIPLKMTLQNRFIRLMSKCLLSSNCILKLIFHCALSNPMSAAGKNYRSLIDDNGECSNSRLVLKDGQIQVKLLKI